VKSRTLKAFVGFRTLPIKREKRKENVEKLEEAKSFKNICIESSAHISGRKKE